MTAPGGSEHREELKNKQGENTDPAPEGKPVIDVRAMLGTDEMKERLKKRQHSKLVLIINIIIFAGLVFLISSLLLRGRGGGLTDEQIELDAYVAEKTLDILADLEHDYFKRYSRYADEKELASEYAVLKKHLDNLASHNHELDVQADSEGFTLTAKPTDGDSRRKSRDVTYRRP